MDIARQLGIPTEIVKDGEIYALKCDTINENGVTLYLYGYENKRGDLAFSGAFDDNPVNALYALNEQRKKMKV